MLSLLKFIVGFIQYIVGQISQALGYIPIVIDTVFESVNFVTATLDYIPTPLLGIAKLTILVTFSLLIVKLLKLVL